MTKIIDMLVLLLVVVGGLNWGLIGFFDYDLVAYFFGDMTTITRVFYGAFGVAAAYYGFTSLKSLS